MAPDRAPRDTHRHGPAPRRPGPVRPFFGLASGRTPRPVARALALATVPLALHLPAPWPSPVAPFATPGGTGTPMAVVSGLPAPGLTPPPSPGITPAPRSTVPSPAGSWPAISDADVATPAPEAQASGSSTPAVTGTSPSPSGAPPAEQPAVRPAEVPWTVRADRLVLRAAVFRGVVVVRTGAGAVESLKFTARSVDVVSLDMTVGRGRAVMRLRTGAGSTSTLEGRGEDNEVTLYVRSLSGTLTALGGTPLPAERTVTVTPGSVPYWLAGPPTPARSLTFVDVTVSPLAQSGAHLSLAGALIRVGAG
ncbi:hypothetical protein [Streptomyces sp. NPDC003393]